MIKQYIRKKNGRKIGVLVAVPVGNTVGIGFSKCRNNEEFDPEFGTDVAFQRAIFTATHSRKYKIPTSIRGDYNRMMFRAQDYYQDKDVVSY